MSSQSLIPPNLANLGVPRRKGPPEADLETIWLTPYPVIRNYKLLCQACGLKPFGGGRLQEQGDASEPGYINSGYRSEILEGNTHSPHLYGFALDIHVGSISMAVSVALEASRRLFDRVGLYPGSSFIHVDLAPPNWVDKYNKSPAWVKVDGLYRPQTSILAAIAFVNDWRAGNQ